MNTQRDRSTHAHEARLKVYRQGQRFLGTVEAQNGVGLDHGEQVRMDHTTAQRPLLGESAGDDAITEEYDRTNRHLTCFESFRSALPGRPSLHPAHE